MTSPGARRCGRHQCCRWGQHRWRLRNEIRRDDDNIDDDYDGDGTDRDDYWRTAEEVPLDVVDDNDGNGVDDDGGGGYDAIPSWPFSQPDYHCCRLLPPHLNPPRSPPVASSDCSPPR